MTKRKFYKTIIEVEVLSQEPFRYDTIDDIANAISNECSGQLINKGEKVLNGKQASKALMNQKSDPELFCLDKDGNDSELGQ